MICLVVGGQGLCLFLVLHAGISTSVCVFDFIDFSAEYAHVCVCMRALFVCKARHNIENGSFAVWEVDLLSLK